MFNVASRAATPDGLLIFFSTLAIWFFVRGTIGTPQRSDNVRKSAPDGNLSIAGLPTRWIDYLAMYAAMSLAVLAKGPVGIVLPTAVIGLYLLVLNPPPRLWGTMPASRSPESDSSSRPAVAFSAPLRHARALSIWLLNTFWPPRIFRFALALRPHLALSVAAVVALPWYIAVGVETDWQWTDGFFWKHNVGRYMTPMEGHQGPPFYHLLSLAVGFFPGSVFLVPVGIHVWRQLRAPQADRRGYVLALSWIAVYLVVFSLAGTKLPSYVTPTYPALALLTGAFMAQWVSRPEQVSRAWVFVALSVYGLVGVGMLVGLVIVLRKFMPGEVALSLLGMIPMLGAAACLACWRASRGRAAAYCFATSAAAFSTALFGWALLRVDPYQEASQINRIVQANATAAPSITTYRVLRPSWVFYSRQELPQWSHPHEAVAAMGRQHNSFLLVEQSRLAEVCAQLPADVHVLGRVRRFLRTGEIVVLGRPLDHETSRPTVRTAQRDFSRIK
jgi:4-amino-4-deoxy-L-arabinose transferase-like glycosyltransferase